MKNTLTEYPLFINGKIAPSAEGKTFDAINPSDGEVFARVADATVNDMQSAVAAAKKAFASGVWTRLSGKERGQYLIKIADLIRENAKVLADLESYDTGKTSKQTTFIDVPTSADTFEYFGKGEDPLSQKVNPVTAPVKSLTQKEPMGVVGCLIPWNYPLIMFAWKVAPALMAGNTVVFRPSSTASVSLMKCAELIASVGLPAGVLNIVASSRHDVAEELIQSRDVDMITFTGGTETGQEVMRLASATTKKLGLELGGKSPNIVFDDCDLEAALGGTLSAIFMNQGQMCTAGSRLLVQEGIYDQFLEQLVKRTQALKIGSSQDYETDFGPLISQRHREKVLEFIEKGKNEGARLVCGGKVPDAPSLQKGFYLEPTIFTDVKNSMAIAQEEIFGPVLCVMKFSDTQEAVQIANDTPFGLASCVWTKDLEKAQEISRQLRCGTVWVNTYGGFYNEAPIGGMKQSGFGRELGQEGLEEYTQTKHICIDQTPGGKSLVTSWF